MEKEYATFQMGHGYLDDRVLPNGICPTIDASIGFWHTLVVEKETKENEEDD